LADRASEHSVFVTRSKFGKRIRLTRATWIDKMLKDHPELSVRN